MNRSAKRRSNIWTNLNVTRKKKPLDEMTLEDLVPRQRKFVQSYLTNNFNATAAALTAGYSKTSAASIGCIMLNYPAIKAVVKKQLEAVFLSPEQVMARLSEMAKANISDFISATGKLNEKNYKEKGYLVKRRKVKRRLRDKDLAVIEDHEVEMYDAQSALVNIGKRYGLFTERVDLTSGGAPIYIPTTVDPKAVCG